MNCYESNWLEAICCKQALSTHGTALVGGVHAATLPPICLSHKKRALRWFYYRCDRLHISQTARVNCSRLFVEWKTCSAEVVSVQTASFEESIETKARCCHTILNYRSAEVALRSGWPGTLSHDHPGESCVTGLSITSQLLKRQE